MKRTTFIISKMDCPTEEQLIRNRLKSVEGIEDLSFDLMQRELTVEHRLAGDDRIVSALVSIGMDPVSKDGSAEDDEAASDAEKAWARRPLVSRTEWILITISGLLAVGAEIVAWSVGQEDALPVIIMSVLSILLGGREMAQKGWRALRTFTLNINFLMTIAVIGALIIGQWPEAAMVTFLFALAEIIEAYALDRSRGAIRSLMELSPDVASVQDGQGGWREVRTSSVKVGQHVRVRPGQRIPLDGTVVTGASTVNQAPITGESMPVEKEAGDPVYAGTINERGYFEFEVTANKKDTTLARIIRAVQQAQASKAPTQRFVDRFSRYYTPTVVALAVLIAAVPPLFFGAAFYPWFYKALVLLVIACPCALVISTPVTVVSGLAAAARRGMLVKGGVYLEEGRRLRTVALDKTGTLTRGVPEVTDVVPFSDGRTEREVLRLAASLDAPSEHPVAAAIVARWMATGGDGAAGGNGLLSVTGFESITGRGVTGEIAGSRYYIGNVRLAEEIGAYTPELEDRLEQLEREGKTAVVLCSEEEALGAIAVADTLRETSIAAVGALHEQGIRTVMLTGDNQATADAIARAVGIDDARGELLPEEKLWAIDELVRTHEVVGMVGDGINDAPALAKASIGFAMGAAGTDTAIETADVALMEDDLRKLPEFIRLSRRTARVLIQNITLAIAIKVVFFVLALAGIATLWMAVFADMGGSLLVVFNGLRLLRQEESEPPYGSA